MKKRTKKIVLTIILVIILLIINYNWIDEELKNAAEESDYFVVTNVVDGDTFDIENGQRIRMLGINTPERGEEYYLQAKEFLEEKIENKTVKLIYGKDKEDRYNRILAYVFLEQKHINLELVREGYANYYFPSGPDFFYDEFKKSWQECLNSKVNLCENSNEICSKCIQVQKVYVEDQNVVFYNSCNEKCSLEGWSLKDEGRKKYTFKNFEIDGKAFFEIQVGKGKDEKNVLYWDLDYVWTKTGDSLFLRDQEGKLVRWESI